MPSSFPHGTCAIGVSVACAGDLRSILEYVRANTIMRTAFLSAVLLVGVCVAQRWPPAHRAVVENSLQEAHLPPHLLNPFYKDHRIRAALARHSWLGPGEMLVRGTHAEGIPRYEIYNVLNHAGFVRTH